MSRATIKDWIEYLAARAVAATVQCFNVRENLNTARAFASMYYRISARHRQRGITNLQRCFPDWTPERLEHVAERSVRHMFELFMVDAFVMPRLITANAWPEHVGIGNLETVMARLVRREPLLLITGHVGNWELLGYTLSVIGLPLHAVARPINNPLLNDWFMGLRQQHGLRIVTKYGATDVLQEVIRRGEQIGFIADQNAGPQGLFVPMFGRMASSYKSIGLLAMRYKVPVVMGWARRLNDRFEYRMEAIDTMTPDDWVDQPDPLFYITARYNRAIENMIREAPEQYLWLHRRWKSRPKYEREGQPIPSRMIEKLETLPWMTQPELDRIIENSHLDAASAKN